MHLHFQKQPVDLYGVLAYSVVVSIILLAMNVGNPLAIVLVAGVPGYLAVAALLPRKEDIDWVMRGALTMGLSLALVAFTGIILDFTPWGITLDSMTISLLALSIVLGIAAYLERMAVDPALRLGGSLVVRRGRWQRYSRFEKGLAVLLVLVLIAAVVLLISSASTPPATEGFTELYLLGPSGTFTGYPVQLNATQPGTVDVVVANHEGAPVNYTLQVEILQLAVVYNTTSGQNETIVANRTPAGSVSTTIPDGGTWTHPWTFSFPVKGEWALQFDLYRAGNLTTPYRATRFLVTVT